MGLALHDTGDQDPGRLDATGRVLSGNSRIQGPDRGHPDTTDLGHAGTGHIQDRGRDRQEGSQGRNIPHEGQGQEKKAGERHPSTPVKKGRDNGQGQGRGLNQKWRRGNVLDPRQKNRHQIIELMAAMIIPR